MVRCVLVATITWREDGLLWQTDENRVADDAIFTSPLPRRFIFPRGSVCVVEKKLVWNQLVCRPKMHPRQSRLLSLE